MWKKLADFFSICNHKWAILRVEHYKCGGMWDYDAPMTRIYKKCSKCKTTTMSFKSGFWNSEELM